MKVNPTSTEFSILGISLGDEKSITLEKLVSPPNVVRKISNRLETWAWEGPATKRSLDLPLRINFVDGKVSQISGSELTVKGVGFNKSSSLTDIRNIVPESEYEEISGPYLRLVRPEYSLTISFASNNNQYTLFHGLLESERNDILCSLADQRDLIDYQKFSIRVNDD